MIRYSLLLGASLALLGCLNEPTSPGKDKNELAYAASTDFWVPFQNSSADEIAVTYGHKPAIIYGGGYIYQWVGSYSSGYWSYLGYGASKIATDEQGRPVVTMPDGGVWRYSSGWSQLPYPSAREVAIGPNGHVYVVTNTAYSGGDYWIAKMGSGGSYTWVGVGKEIAVNQHGELFNAMAGGSVWKYVPSTATWTQLPPNNTAPSTTKATDIAHGNDCAFLIADDFDGNGDATIWQIAGTNWFSGNGRGKRIAMANIFDIFTIKGNGAIYQHYFAP